MNVIITWGVTNAGMRAYAKKYVEHLLFVCMLYLYMLKITYLYKDPSWKT